MASRIRGPIATGEAPWTGVDMAEAPAKATAVAPVDPRKPRLESAESEVFIDMKLPSLSLEINRE